MKGIGTKPEKETYAEAADRLRVSGMAIAFSDKFLYLVYFYLTQIREFVIIPVLTAI
jgi:hypothetical protein